jgi:hypothetical protein
MRECRFEVLVGPLKLSSDAIRDVAEPITATPSLASHDLSGDEPGTRLCRSAAL